jgi:tRNA-dependent cyclodipeptide synthase
MQDDKDSIATDLETCVEQDSTFARSEDQSFSDTATHSFTSPAGLLKLYKANFCNVAPPQKLKPGTNSRAVLGISLNNKNFSRQKIDAMVELIGHHFGQCILLVADSIYRLTLQAAEGIDSTTAIERAMKLGDEFISANLRSITDPRFSVLRCTDIAAQDEVRQTYQQLERRYTEDVEFNESVSEFARSYQQRIDRQCALTYQYAVSYLLEELAIFSYLVKRGNNVIVYPGNINTVATIACNPSDENRDMFPDLVFASVRFKSRAAGV